MINVNELRIGNFALIQRVNRSKMDYVRINGITEFGNYERTIWIESILGREDFQGNMPEEGVYPIPLTPKCAYRDWETRSRRE